MPAAEALAVFILGIVAVLEVAFTGSSLFLFFFFVACWLDDADDTS